MKSPHAPLIKHWTLKVTFVPPQAVAKVVFQVSTPLKVSARGLIDPRHSQPGVEFVQVAWIVRGRRTLAQQGTITPALLLELDPLEEEDGEEDGETLMRDGPGEDTGATGEVGAGDTTKGDREAAETETEDEEAARGGEAEVGNNTVGDSGEAETDGELGADKTDGEGDVGRSSGAPDKDDDKEEESDDGLELAANFLGAQQIRLTATSGRPRNDPTSRPR